MRRSHACQALSAQTLLLREIRVYVVNIIMLSRGPPEITRRLGFDLVAVFETFRSGALRSTINCEEASLVRASESVDLQEEEDFDAAEVQSCSAKGISQSCPAHTGHSTIITIYFIRDKLARSAQADMVGIV